MLTDAKSVAIYSNKQYGVVVTTFLRDDVISSQHSTWCMWFNEQLQGQDNQRRGEGAGDSFNTL